ncbi:MAG: stage II sporulation protein M [Woeseiaceae bacterium]|nr:stage II sporulation protein M [Woeseiaceae bacterium]
MATPESWAGDKLPEWRESAERLTRIEKSKHSSRDDLLKAVHSYGEIARDLTVAERLSPGGKLTRFLKQLYARYHRALHKKPGTARQSFKNLFLNEIVDITWDLREQIFWVTALFVASLLAGWWLISTYPELAALLASEQMINGAARGELWTDDLLNVVPSSVLAVQILTNNIIVSLFAATLGVFYGLGTIYIMGLNGLMIGGIFAMVAQYQLAGRLFEFVIAHGVVELSVICIAGAVGVSLGASIARPGNQTRARSFQQASTRAAKLVFVCALFLVGAGIIEGYVSPSDAYPFAFKVFVGIVYFLLFAAVLGGVPRRLLAARRANGVRSGAAP